HPFKAKRLLDGVLERADRAIDEGRDAVQGLRTAAVVTGDLRAALVGLGHELVRETGQVDSVPPVFSVVMSGTPRPIQPTIQDEIYQVAREALRNAFVHARARMIEAEISYHDDLFRLRIRDDGTGLDPGILEGGGRSRHFGLLGMRERARRIGGTLD